MAAPDLCRRAGFLTCLILTTVAAAGAEEIWAIQGPGLESPLLGHRVMTGPNVVTAVSTNGFFMQTPPEHDFYSSANTACIALPAHTVRALFAAHPALFPLIIEEIGARTRLLMQWTGQSVTASPAKRMARLIGILLEAQGNSEPSGTLRATQERLARLARCSRQSANGLLRELEKQRLIELAYGHIKVPNAKVLAAFAEE